jgi:hypothetical protein
MELGKANREVNGRDGARKQGNKEGQQGGEERIICRKG